MRIVVVGATGNIGTALLRAVGARGSITSVDAVSRRGPGRLASAPDASGGAAVRHHRLDAAAPEGSSDDRALRSLATGADAVVHLAWAPEGAAGHSAERISRTNAAITAGVLRAATSAQQLVVASCASVYAPSYGNDPRDEHWPTTGIPGVPSSQDKVGLERALDRFESAHPRIVVTRLRPTLTLQESAGAALARRYGGPFLPRVGLGRSVPVLLWPAGLTLQVTHADDVAAAFLAAIERRAPGAYNVADETVSTGEEVAAALGADRLVEVPRGVAAVGHRVAWWTHLLRARPQWLDLLDAQPVLDGTRARQLLGARTTWEAADVLRSTARGVARRREGWTPALSRRREPAQENGDARP